MGPGPSLISPELSLHQNIVGRNRTMPKKVKMIFCLAACFGVIFTFLPRPALAEAGKPVAAAVDGENIWVTDNVGRDPAEITFDGSNIWVINYGSGNLTKI